jgi:polar amino acid transport system substrate-binding protein
MMPRLLHILVLLLLAVGAQPAAARTIDAIRRSGEIRIGVNPNFPPMSSYGDDNRLSGFDVDIARRLADALGVRLSLVPTEAAQRVPFLVSGRIDASMGALTITPERQALIDFTIPLHSEAMGVITTDRIKATRWQDLNRADITLVNMRGNQSVEVLREKLPLPRRLLVDGNADTIRSIAQGRADALVENTDFFLGFTRNYPEVKWRVLPEPIFAAWCGIGVAKGNQGLQLALDRVLHRMHIDGTVAALWRKHYGADMTVPVGPEQVAPALAPRPAASQAATGYRLDWGPVLAQLPYLLGGALVSLEIAFLAFWAGAAIGLAGAIGLLYGGGGARRVVRGYVALFTNTPALVQIFLLYYALPDAGIKLDSFTAVSIGLTLNAGAYLTEIIRAGVSSVRRSELEAAAVLGLGRGDLLVHVILPHVMKTVYRPLASFFIVLVLGSSMAALFGVEELTGRAINISTASLRTIETFAVAGAIYIALTLLASAALAWFGRALFRVPMGAAR